VQPEFSAAPAIRPQAPVEQVEAAVRVLLSARKPILVAGGGVVPSGAQAEVLALAEQLNIPVATSLNGKGTILDTHPLSVGVVGSYSRECANRAVSLADVVFFIGSRTGSQVTHSWAVPAPGTKVIHLDIEPKELGRNYAHTTPVAGDARTALRQMLGALKGRGALPGSKMWVEEVQRLVADWRAREKDLLESAAQPIRPERLCAAISKVLPKDGIVVSDTGHSGMWSSTLIDFTRPGQRYIRCAGSLGWSFPAAMGVKCALPDRAVVCFNGDGAFYYHLAELETAARHGINVVVVVNNNSAFNQEIRLVDEAYKGLQAQRAEELWKFRDVNFAQIAESFGCVGMRVTSPGDLEKTLEKAIAANRPVVVDVVTDVQAMARRGWKPATS
jgi:acetolactate synthase-1/2/3 large subunit